MSLTVSPVNDAPTFNQDLGDQTNAEGTGLVSLSAAATDPDGDALTYAASGLPSGLSIDPGSGLISGTLSLSAAAGSPYSVSVTVRDGLTVEATDTFSWTVTPIVIPPPASPTGLTAAVSSTSITLDWSDNAAGGLAGYNVYRSATAGGPFTKVNVALLTASTYRDATAPQGTSYYRVTAVGTDAQESTPAATSGTIQIRFVGASAISGNTTAVTLARPAAMVAGDAMIAAVSVLGTGTIVPPAGWSLVGSQLSDRPAERVPAARNHVGADRLRVAPLHDAPDLRGRERLPRRRRGLPDRCQRPPGRMPPA